mgnify:CR=1 FL=1
MYRRKVPFHPERLLNWVKKYPSSIVRSKGLMWLATRNNMAISFSHAGTSKQLSPAGLWVAALSQEELDYHFGGEVPRTPDWDETWGDRVTKLVFIGVDMNREEIETSLDAALLTSEELHGNWRELNDPLPFFG